MNKWFLKELVCCVGGLVTSLVNFHQLDIHKCKIPDELNLRS